MRLPFKTETSLCRYTKLLPRNSIKTSGWRFSVRACTLAMSCTFLINGIVFLWSLKKFGADSDGLQRLFIGSCVHVRRLNVVVHIYINIVSTIIMASSNLCMQCLTAPTRAEVERAHQKPYSNNPYHLQIGVPSIRNLIGIDGKRVCIWALLALSSIPLHLL